jgi:hypothetical protein
LHGPLDGEGTGVMGPSGIRAGFKREGERARVGEGIGVVGRL